MQVDGRNAASTDFAIELLGNLSCRQEVDGGNRAALRLGALPDRIVTRERRRRANVGRESATRREGERR